MMITGMVSAGCGDPVKGFFMPREYQAFFESPFSGQREALLEFPIEKQIDIYLYGVKVYHPPRVDLAFVIARQGPKVIAPLLARLKQENDDHTRSDLMEVLAAVRIVNPQFRYDQDVIQYLEEVTHAMNNANAKRLSEDSLRILKSERPEREVLPRP